MSDPLPLQNTTPYNSEDNNKNKNFYILAGIFLVVIFLLTGGIFYMDKLGIRYEEKSDTPIHSAASENPNTPTPPLSPEISQSLIDFSKEVVNQEYQLSTISSYEKSVNQEIGGVEFIVEKAMFSNIYAEDLSTGEYWGIRTFVVERGSKVYEFPIVIQMFNKYFKMPNNVEDWEVSSNSGSITYEIVMDNSDGSFDTRTSLVNLGNEPYIVVAACRITPANPLFSKRSCLVGD